MPNARHARSVLIRTCGRRHAQGLFLCRGAL